MDVSFNVIFYIMEQYLTENNFIKNLFEDKDNFLPNTSNLISKNKNIFFSKFIYVVKNQLIHNNTRSKSEKQQNLYSFFINRIRMAVKRYVLTNLMLLYIYLSSVLLQKYDQLLGQGKLIL